MDAGARGCWEDAAGTDPTLAARSGPPRALGSKQIHPVRYSRKRLFTAMARQEPVIFADSPLRASFGAFFVPGRDPVEQLRPHIRPSSTTLARLGPAQTLRRMRVHDLMDRWQRDRQRVVANDTYFRDLKLDRVFDCDAISDFNILRNTPLRISDLEVATILLGTAGCMTDSHSDDPDGANHCIAGKKLWLVWDRREGERRGIEDTEYGPARRRARFDLRSFASLPSAGWFLMTPGRTLFLPGHLTHKVITLERYCGISSFYVSLPNALASLSRWRLRGARMVTESLWREILALVARRLRLVSAGDRRAKERWGFYFIPEALRHWSRRHTERDRARMLADPAFRGLHEAMRRACG